MTPIEIIDSLPSYLIMDEEFMRELINIISEPRMS